jgi:protein-disulfide isomerase
LSGPKWHSTRFSQKAFIGVKYSRTLCVAAHAATAIVAGRRQGGPYRRRAGADVWRASGYHLAAVPPDCQEQFVSPPEAPASATARPLPFRQPKDLIRWLAVFVALAGWYFSLQLLQVSVNSSASNPFLAAVCSSGRDDAKSDCAEVLSAPQAYLTLGPNLPKMPVSALGLSYFGAVALWFLLIGPPTRPARFWHLCILLFVLGGAGVSLSFIRIMHFELHRWCIACLIVHGINGVLLVLTLLAYPWRAAAQPVVPHPTPRLVLATVVAGVLAFAAQVGLMLALLFGAIVTERMQTYGKVLEDPAFVRWDYERQAPVSIPEAEDQVYEGPPDAPDTVVVFSDFQCPNCLKLHQLLEEVQRKYPGRIRVASRHYPSDSECNPYVPLGGAHASACRAARAVEAAALLGGSDGYLALSRKLWQHQGELPAVPYARQTAAQRDLFATWAAELGLDRAAFAAALESRAAAARVQADVELGHQLAVAEVPTVYVNGKLLRSAQRIQAWDALLGSGSSATTQPASASSQP